MQTSVPHTVNLQYLCVTGNLIGEHSPTSYNIPLNSNGKLEVQLTCGDCEADATSIPNPVITGKLLLAVSLEVTHSHKVHIPRCSNQ